MFNIAVLGTGYVGLVAGACFAHVGHKVVCVDVDEEKIKLLSDGVCPVFEPQLPEIIEKTMREGRLRFTTSYEDAFKNADDYCARTFSLPMHPYLEKAEQQAVIDAVLEAL